MKGVTMENFRSSASRCLAASSPLSITRIWFCAVSSFAAAPVPIVAQALVIE